MSKAPKLEEAGVTCLKNVKVPMRDGIRLATDVYFPTMKGKRLQRPLPVILERTPYGKDEQSRSERTHLNSEPLTRAEVARYFSDHQYIVVYQDCRGRHGSEGEFTKYLSDAQDGYDTCAWLVDQPWCDGNIGMKGLSYAAHTQMAAACAAAPGLRAMVVDSGGFSNGYQSGIRQGGAYELKQAAWAVMFAAEHSRRNTINGFQLTPEDLDRWFKRMPWRRGDSPLTPTPDYEDFLFDQWERGTFDDYWKQPGIYAEGYYDKLKDVATIHMSSWYDVYTRTAVENFLGMRRHGAPTRLILGPWTHGNRWESHSGDVDFGPSARLESNLAPSFLEMRLSWFDRWLKGCRNGADLQPPIMIFVMGSGTGTRTSEGRLDHGGRWRAESEWPISGCEKVRHFLHSSGLLSRKLPDERDAYREYVFDPLDPVPTIGGSVVSRPPAIFAGGFDQVEQETFFSCKQPGRALADRADVLVFQTEPLEEDVEVTGDIEAVLWISSNCIDTDFTAKLVDVYPPNSDYRKGYALNVTDGIIRTRYRNSWERPTFLQAGEVYRVSIKLFPTSNVFKRGHRIRVDISSSNFPKFDVNPNTGEDEAKGTRMTKAINRVHMSKFHQSFVSLPIVSRTEGC